MWRSPGLVWYTESWGFVSNVAASPDPHLEIQDPLWERAAYTAVKESKLFSRVERHDDLD